MFWISDVIPENESHPTTWYIILNTTSGPYECNISTLDYAVGKHKINLWVRETNTSAYTGGGSTYYFEHQDRSGEQILYTSATIAVYAISIVGVFVIGYVSYRLLKRRSRNHNSRFERDSTVS